MRELVRPCFFVFKLRLRGWMQIIPKQQNQQSDATQKMEALVSCKTCASVFAWTGKDKLRLVIAHLE